jgi:indolepyruvate ferredoxin oxidoreductase beta subunit
MRYDIIVAGVGGQGTLSVSSVIASTAMSEGLFVKQSELHGMSQRGGAVVAHLRISDKPIASDMIPVGAASMILSMEPLESLRYLGYLSADGILVTSTDPLNNISNYPEMEEVLGQIELTPHHVLLDADQIAKQSGSSHSGNMVMVGAASHFLPVRSETIEKFISEAFARKGEKVVAANLKAFQAGRRAAEESPDL